MKSAPYVITRFTRSRYLHLKTPLFYSSYASSPYSYVLLTRDLANVSMHFLGNQ